MIDFKFFRDENPYRITSVRELVNDDPSSPSYYDVSPDFMCVGVTPRRTNPVTYETYRHLVYEDVRSGRMTQANIIDLEHPMYNYYREIEPDFYNSRYVDRR